jgi:transcriptional regulator with AAA-type ATPase domain
MGRGPRTWHAKLPPGEYEHFLLRRRADLAEPFAELALTPHPWSARALDRLGSKILQTMSLFLQLRARGAKAGASAVVGADHEQWPDLILTLTYPNRDNWEDLIWRSGNASSSNTVPTAFDSHPDPDDQEEESRYVLKVNLRRERFHQDAIEFLESELRFQVRRRSLLLAKPRPNFEELPSNWLENIWDLRIRLTDFARRFLTRYRNQDFVDPFTVFFLTPSSTSESPHHVHSGHFGYEFVIDDGQKDYLARNGIGLDPEKPLWMPFPNGVCASVFLEARASSAHDLTEVSGDYSASEVPEHVKLFEDSVLQTGLLIEVPAYAPGIGPQRADGPEIIVTFHIQPPMNSAERANGNQGERPPSAADDQRIASKLVSRDTQILSDGEAQVLTEICQRLISIYLRARPSGPGRRILFRSPTMTKVQHAYLRMAQSDCHILIGGDSGTGKSYAAEEIARFSRRGDVLFARISAATISTETTMSQLFGHKEGAFTGANDAKAGLLTALNGGTLFLDDVDALDSLAQARLLSYLDTKQFYRFGAEHEEPLVSDVRFICATNVKIADLLNAGDGARARMRPDFLYRIAEQYFEMPKLKERREDIALLIRHFVEEQYERAGRQFAPPIDPSFEEVAMRHPWSEGDLRQLKHAVLAAMIQSDAEMLTGRELQAIIDSSQLWKEGRQ